MSCTSILRRLVYTLGACLPLTLWATVPVKSMIIFGDSLSDNGNTTHLLKSLRKDENPAYLVKPLKVFVIHKMNEFADDYHVPQMVLDKGVGIVTVFFDQELAPMLANIVGKVRKVPVLPPEPYWQNHFSNGRVWAEYLAPMVGVDREDNVQFVDRAYGGGWAQTYDHQLTTWNLIRHPINSLKNLVAGKLIPPSLGITIQSYLLTNPVLDPKATYFIFEGANDYLNALNFEDNYNPAKMSKYVDNVITNIHAGARRLINSGARNIVVIGLPGLGNVPRFNLTMDKEVLNHASQLHNERLEYAVSQWQAAMPQADFLYIDIAALMEAALNDPTQYGLDNVTDACIDFKLPTVNAFADAAFPNNYALQYVQALQSTTNYQVCDTPNKYLFWDELHPTTIVHQHLAYQICETMKEHGYLASCKQPS